MLFASDGRRNGWGVELANSGHTWLQEHETISPRKRRLERPARLVAGERDGGEVKHLPSVWKKRGKKEGRQAWTQKLVDRSWSLASLDTHLYAE